MSDRMPYFILYWMPKCMSDRMPDYMSDIISENFARYRMGEYMSNRILECMSDRIPENMSDRIPKYISDRMTEYMSKYSSWNAMVGITQRKVIYIHQTRKAFGQSCTILIVYGFLGWQCKTHVFVFLVCACLLIPSYFGCGSLWGFMGWGFDLRDGFRSITIFMQVVQPYTQFFIMLFATLDVHVLSWQMQLDSNKCGTNDAITKVTQCLDLVRISDFRHVCWTNWHGMRQWGIQRSPNIF